MRPILAILLTVLFLGGTYAYTQFAASVQYTASDYQADYTEDEFFIEIRKTFDSPPHPIFGESVVVKFKGDAVYKSDENVSATEVIRVGPLPEVEIGENEILVTASRGDSGTDRSDQGNGDSSGTGAAALAVIQVKILRNETTVVEKMISAEPGLPMVRGEVEFSVDAETKPDQIP